MVGIHITPETRIWIENIMMVLLSLTAVAVANFGGPKAAEPAPVESTRHEWAHAD